MKNECVERGCGNPRTGGSYYCVVHLSDVVSMAGTKHDQGKLEFHLLPWLAVKSVTSVLMFGAKKYAPENWRSVPLSRDRYFDAAMRHLIAWRGDEKLDPESGLHHLAHAACCILFMLELDNG